MSVQKKRDAPMMHIGANKQGIEQVAQEIIEVLATNAGDAVKIKALDVLEKVGSVSNVSVTGCSFYGGKGR